MTSLEQLHMWPLGESPKKPQKKEKPPKAPKKPKPKRSCPSYEVLCLRCMQTHINTTPCSNCWVKASRTAQQQQPAEDPLEWFQEFNIGSFDRDMAQLTTHI